MPDKPGTPAAAVATAISDNTLKLAYNVLSAQTLNVGSPDFAELAPIFSAALQEIAVELAVRSGAVS